ncbi:hypothetical protein VTK26DRAFT_2848 [Humicola hyalothermophila]
MKTPAKVMIQNLVQTGRERLTDKPCKTPTTQGRLTAMSLRIARVRTSRGLLAPALLRGSTRGRHGREERDQAQRKGGRAERSALKMDEIACLLAHDLAHTSRTKGRGWRVSLAPPSTSSRCKCAAGQISQCPDWMGRWRSCLSMLKKFLMHCSCRVNNLHR